MEEVLVLPLCEMALLKSPLANGENNNEYTLCPPADSPNIVILVASPPNRSMLFLIHLSAKI